MPSDILGSISPSAARLDESDIVAIMNLARTMDDVVPLWVGEGDIPTPDFIVRAANEALKNGETFYTWQRGIPELRDALARYHSEHFDRPHDTERYYVTGSGMQAIQLSLQALVQAGDEVVMLTPCWPNIHAAAQVCGAVPVHVELDFNTQGWSLDVDRLADAITPNTRVLFINSPANPSGWTADREILQSILELARKHGLWIIADEVYSRFTYDVDRAPSFYDVMEEDDRILFVNTFSKNWAMTGWRAGWISAPPEVGQVLENLIQYSTSGVAPFIQRGAVAALEEGEPFFQMQKERAQRNRTVVCEGLQSTDKIQLAIPPAAFYLFFKIPGYADSKALALRIIEEAGVGLAPGTGFYTGGTPYLRMCFLRDPLQIERATQRLVDWVGTI
ncbi:MAG: pyridoxal phosphate-dependent aminotransferase [Pseudomonadota bacterium]